MQIFKNGGGAFNGEPISHEELEKCLVKVCESQAVRELSVLIEPGAEREPLLSLLNSIGDCGDIKIRIGIVQY